jgi:hypothetical protein
LAAYVLALTATDCLPNFSDGTLFSKRLWISFGRMQLHGLMMAMLLLATAGWSSKYW